MAAPTLNEIREFFGIENAAAFRKEWMELSPESRAQIKTGIENGTLTY